MKFEKFTFRKNSDWIYILPSIEINVNAPEYYYKNIAICFHFIIWHFRWFWIKREQYLFYDEFVGMDISGKEQNDNT